MLSSRHLVFMEVARLLSFIKARKVTNWLTCLFSLQSVIIPTGNNLYQNAICFMHGRLLRQSRFGSYRCDAIPNPQCFEEICIGYDATLILVDGLINDCAAKVQQLNQNGQYFDVSTLKEPYRLEGKKTMGYEIAEQLDWQLPDVIMYPTEGRTGLIGIWKAFYELKAVGWLTPEQRLPRMVAVQAENCAPIVATY